MDTNFFNIVNNFLPDCRNVDIQPLGKGIINDSYKVLADRNSYALQRINHKIFKNVPQLQDNILRVTTHIRKKLLAKSAQDVDRKVLTLLPAIDGTYFYKDAEGNFWRMMKFITDSYSYETVNEKFANNAGTAFGEFQDMLSDLPGEPLFETIPGFHNMESRLEQFRAAVKRNAAGRLSEVHDLVDEIESRSWEMCKAERLHREGKLPKRINHCDTKVNNVLFDVNGNILCVVDLDTVMPGYVLSDFGDFMRTAANNGEEDDQDLSRVSINLGIFKAYAEGYLNAARFLTPIETENLPFGATLLTYMQLVRFLADYMDGDTYYKIAYPKHNLQRSLAQFKLLQSMEEHFDEMNQIVMDIVKAKG